MLEQIYSVLPQLVKPHLGIFRLAHNDHFLLFELMDSVYASLFQTVCAFFLTEARRIAGQSLRQLFFGMMVSINLPIMECSEVPIR